MAGKVPVDKRHEQNGLKLEVNNTEDIWVGEGNGSWFLVPFLFPVRFLVEEWSWEVLAPYPPLLLVSLR